MTILGKSLRFLFRMVLGILLAILLYVLAVFVGSLITVNAEPEKGDAVTVYIINNGVHTDIVLPLDFGSYDQVYHLAHKQRLAEPNSYRYLALGWGDKGFYLNTPTWSELQFSVAFNAAFGLSTTAMHATYYKEMKEGPSCKKMTLSTQQYDQLMAFITASFQQDAQGQFIQIVTDANYGDTDAFYEANGAYSLLHSCNTWANEGLKHGGQRACLWTIVQQGIFSKYE